ncbi:MAG: serine hydrolase [Eubacterium sp.]|nr:serine hydrolase [Eubacterium sp.]
MKKIVLTFIIIVWGTLAGILVHGTQQTEVMANHYDINGYSIAYYENGEIVFQNYGDGINEKSVFELASNGKAVSAYIALKLVDEGKLNLESKIAPFLNNSLITDDERIYDITLEQLLCHTAGFSPSFELGVDKKIYANPGEKFCYSGVGYIYLQNIIENVSGMTIEQAAQHYVFAPLEMNNSTFEHSKTVTPYIKLSSVVIYVFTVFIVAFVVLLLFSFIIGKITKFRFFTYRNSLPVCFVAAGIVNILFLMFVFVSKVTVMFLVCFLFMGLSLLFTRRKEKIFYASIPILIILIMILGFTIPVSIPVTNDIVAKTPNCAYTLKSTSEDMAIFCKELMKQYYGGEGAVKDMFSTAVNIDIVNSWGLGIAIEQENNGETYWHSGINPGFQSLFVLYPLQDKYVVVLTNSDNGLSFAKEIAKTFLGIDGYWDIKR